MCGHSVTEYIHMKGNFIIIKFFHSNCETFDNILVSVYLFPITLGFKIEPSV